MAASEEVGLIEGQSPEPEPGAVNVGSPAWILAPWERRPVSLLRLDLCHDRDVSFSPFNLLIPL